ncbi:MAG: MMPL family transporter [Pseudomonadales bacterium]|nr:MMPL family transporter [Pseudomonadales bacterium]
MTAITGFLIGQRHALLLLSALATLVFAIGIPRSGFDTSLGVLLTQSDPYLQERDRMVAEFPGQQEISFALLPRSGNVFERETLLALADLQREFRNIPLAISMNSILAWQSPLGDDRLFDRTVTAQTDFSAQELADAKARVLANPFLAGTYLSPQADLALTTVRLRVAALTPEQSRATSEASIALRERLQAQHPDVEIFVSSEALYEQSNRDAMISDLTLLLPLILLLCSAIISYAFRSLLLGLEILIVALVTVIMTVGSLGWALQTFNTISVMAPLVVVTVAVADSVHIISLFRQSLQAGASPVAAMQQSLQFNLRPITLATITTVIGFASLNLASSPAISSFGTVVAIGVGFAYTLTLIMLPGMVLLLPSSRLRAQASSPPVPIISVITGFFQRLINRQGQRLIVGCSLLGGIALGLSFLNTTDFDRGAFISDDSPLHDYYDAVSQHMERGPQLGFGVDTGRVDGVMEPAFLRQLDEFSDWLRQQEEVVGVASLVEVVKTVNQVVNENRAEAYLIPDSAAEVEEALFNYQVAQADDFALDTLVNEDFSLLRLFIATNTQNNHDIIALSDRIDAQFRQQFASASLLHGSNTLLFARMDNTVTIELLQGYGFSLLLITLTLIIGMRSIYYGLLSMLPNLLPALLVFGAWGLLVGTIDPFVMMLFSISIGLVVDDTVHVLSIFQRGRRDGLSPVQAVEQALHKAGPALIITTAVMALGTCVLIAASTLYFQQAATLLVPIVVVALVLDLSFFPALLLRLEHSSLPLQGYRHEQGRIEQARKEQGRKEQA